MDIKNLIISIDAGHTKDNTKDSGAASNIANEHKMNIDVKNLIMQKLKNLGANVIDCSLENCSSLSESLSYRTNKSNNANAKIHLCVHHNAGVSQNGKAVNSSGGAEVEYTSTEGAKLAQCIQDEFVKLGLRNRGIQHRDNLYILNHTNAVTALTEGCFVDSINDMKLYSAEKEANAIVNGLLKYLGLNISQNSSNKKPTQKLNLSENIILKLNDKNNNVKILQEMLNKLGFNCGNADGIFGNGTLNAVKNLQSKYKLTSDGIVGPNTIKKLNSLQ
jgi:N-acetylmuramoyl-L-alanine amidase